MKIDILLVVMLFVFTANAQDTDESGIFLDLETAEYTQSSQTADTIGNDSAIIDTLVEQIPSLEKEPVLVTFVKSVYPQSLLRQAITGIVTIDLLVSETGSVDSVHILNGLHPALDSEVVAAVKQFVFTPAMADGIAVPVILTYEYRVTLDEVIDSISEYVNFSGVLLERGTRNAIRDAEVYVTFPDSSIDTMIKIPFSMYLEKIGTFEGQRKESLSIITTTDSTGHFQFKSLPPGPLTVTIPAVGYESFRSDDTINAKEALDVTYRLQKTSYADYEIVVYGKAEEKEVSRRTLTLSEVKKIPGFGGDAVKVVQALPGVARPSFGGGAVVVRGSPTWDSKFFIDGIQIPQLYHFGGVKSTYNSDALKSVDLYPGGFGVRYGSTIAGVIELESRNAASDRIKGFVDVNLFDATAFVEGPASKKTGVIISGRRSYIGDILGYITRKKIIDIPITVVPFYYDYLARVNTTVNDKNMITASVFGSNDELELIAPFVRGGSSQVDELTDRIRQRSAFTMFAGGWDFSLTSSIKNNLRLALTPSKGFISAFGQIKLENDSWMYELHDELQAKINDIITLDIGANLWYVNYHQVGIFPSQSLDNTFTRDTTDLKLGQVGPYMQLELKPVENLLIVPGIRYDYYHELNYKGGIVPEFWEYEGFDNNRGYSGEPSARLSMRYEFIKNHTAKVAFGTYNQTPQPIGFVINERFGNPALPATKARHITGGYDAQFSDLLSADIQFYHNNQWDIPDSYTSEERRNNDDVEIFLPLGKGKMYGMELLLRHDQGDRFFGWIAYTLSRSERYNRTEKRWALYDRDQTHNLQLIASYRLKKEWEIGTKVRFISGNPRTPIIDAIHNMRGFYYAPVNGKENSEREMPVFQVDMRLDKKFVYDKWMFSAYLDFQNVLNFIYASPEFTIYDFDYSDETVVSVPFIPSFGLRAEF